MLCIEYIQMSRKRIWWIVWAWISLEHSHFYFTWKVLISEIMSCIFCACLSKPLMFCLDLNIFNIYQPQCYNDLCDKPPDFSIIIWITSNTSDGLTMFRKMCKFRKNISLNSWNIRLYFGRKTETFWWKDIKYPTPLKTFKKLIRRVLEIVLKLPCVKKKSNNKNGKNLETILNGWLKMSCWCAWMMYECVKAMKIKIG